MKKLYGRTRCPTVLAVALTLLWACDKNGPTTPTPLASPTASKAFTDSAAGTSAAIMATTPPSSVTTISVKAGDKLTVTVQSTDCSGDPETVNVYGVLTQQVLSGTCGTGHGAILNESNTIGPVGSDGTVYFTATHQVYGEGAPLDP
jgi:hypothetical protein